MLTTFARILPLALTAAISPTGLLLVMSILSGKESPVKKSRAFILGAFVFLIALGLLISLTFHPAVQQTSNPGKTSAVIDIVLGLLILGVLVVSVFHKKKEKPAKKKKRKRPYTLLGFGYMLVNYSTLIPYIAAAKIINDGDLGFWEKLPLFVILILITMSLVSLPVAVTWLFPEQSGRILGPVKTFMSRHGRMIANVFFLAMAIYLIVYGVSRI